MDDKPTKARLHEIASERTDDVMAQAAGEESFALKIALDALQAYQSNWDTGLPAAYAEGERVMMECACEAVRDALNEALATRASEGAPVNLFDDCVASVCAARNGEPAPDETCGHCSGSGWMVRDSDIGTDQECFVCEGTGKFEVAPVAAANALTEIDLNELYFRAQRQSRQHWVENARVALASQAAPSQPAAPAGHEVIVSLLGCELNRDYEPLQRGRIIQRGLEIA